MKVLTLSSLFPSTEDPLTAPFIGERTDGLSQFCEVRVVSPAPSSNFKPMIRNAAFRHHSIVRPTYLAFPTWLKGMDGLSLYSYVLPTVRRIKRLFPFDIIDAHWSFPEGYAAVMLGKELDVPVSITVRGSDVNRFLKDWRFRRRVREALSQGACCIAVSSKLRDVALSEGVSQNKFYVVRNGVNTGLFHPSPRREARQILGLPSGQTIMLYVGRLVPNKRLDILIETVALLRTAQSPVRLYIVGTVDSRFRSHHKAIRQLVQARNVFDLITFIDPVAPTDLRVWYSAADLVCLSSDNEGCPNVLLEALACGTPVVARKVGGVSEIVCSEKLGMLVGSDDPRAFANAVALSCKTIWDYEYISRQAHGRNWRTVGEEVAHIFQDVIRARRDRCMA
jgi:teichuronic acid biosynthesis glycosyltransferase TuaC